MMVCQSLLRMGMTALAALTACVLFGAGCSDDNGVTYARDIGPLFQDCTLCHRPDAPYGPALAVDILNPYSPDAGLVNATNLWKAQHPEIASPPRTVVAGNPDESFLMQKIADPASGLLPAEFAGSPMPLQIEALSEAELTSIVEWIEAGAEDTADFRSNVAPIFGNPSDPVSAPGKCLYCHYEGTPNPPDLSDPFGPNGLVNVTARFRTDMLRVAPNNPEASFLILKVRASQPSSDVGAPMPKAVPILSEAQVDRVRQWILEGAQP